MKVLIFTCLFMLVISLSYADCDMMAMLAKNGHQTSDPEFENEADFFFQFQATQSRASAQEDGYGVIYYKNNLNTIYYNYEEPLHPDNQAFFLIGSYNSSWYQCHGPDAYNNYYNDSNHPSGPDYDWIDISGIGTSVTFTHNDVASGPFDIGFDFDFYGETYNEFIINPNGWIGFESDYTAWENLDIYDDNVPGPAIFGFWDDLDPLQAGEVYYHSNENRIVIWFNEVIHYPGNQNGTYDFQIILFSNGNIKFQYQSVIGDSDSASIGIKGAESTPDTGFFQVVYNDDYVEDELALLFSSDVYPEPEPLDIAQERITSTMINYDAVIVLGHDRDRGWTSQDAAGQHPYRFEWNEKTYTFQHNGNQNAKQEMIDYCLEIDPDWFDIDNHPLNWVFLGNDHTNVATVGDTELLLHYIMAHVIEFNGDVIAGLISALNEQDLEGYNFRQHLMDVDDEVNIVLSDGKALYVFRNTEPDILNPNSYNLSYKDYENGFVGVKTQSTINGGSQVQQYSLVVIPREGDIVTYENVFDLDAKTYTFPSQFTIPDCGWKWLSFDILYPEPDDNIAEFFLAPISGINELDYALFKPHSPGSQPWTISFHPFQQNLNHPFTSPYGYKFKTINACEFTVTGQRCEAGTSIHLYGNNQENWIGYFLEDTQYVYDAFAGHLDEITKIKAQHWAIKKVNGVWPPDIAAAYTISPGDMVIVYCERDIPTFSWSSGDTREKFNVPASQDFTYEEEADYIPVFIELDPEDMPSEIGAFVDGECKGATVVQDTSAQICAYILENQGENLEFEFSYGSREQNKQIREYGICEPETSKTVKGTIQIDNNRDCYYVSFKDRQNSHPSPAKVEITNFPNPFNPETTLFFSLPNEQKIELTIYNLKGQKVRQLAKGQFPSGNNSIVWNGKDDNGKPVGSGIYFYKLKTNEKVISKKMLLLK